MQAMERSGPIGASMGHQEDIWGHFGVGRPGGGTALVPSDILASEGDILGASLGHQEDIWGHLVSDVLVAEHDWSRRTSWRRNMIGLLDKWASEPLRSMTSTGRP